MGRVALEAMFPELVGPLMVLGPTAGGSPGRVAVPFWSRELGMISVRPSCSRLSLNRTRVAGLKNMLLMSEPPALMPA